jgi:predicted histone-like DNA-binding protein
MSKILYEVYQNDIKDSESVMFGRWYARLKSVETLSIEKLAKHISEHGSVFTADVVEGVMKKFKTCLLEMLLESKKVKVAGLGTFYLTCECTKGGAEKESEFNVNQHLQALHIRFLPDQTAEDNLSSREFIKKAEFVNVKSLLSGKADEEGDDDEENGEQGGSQNGGTQNGGTSGGDNGGTTGGGTTGGDNGGNSGGDDSGGGGSNGGGNDVN